ncbi:MAG TPA: hypothetical protein VLC95_10640 [Anaerolineae bacterium]|nr:hypothetical protein [Anaerolineae bacterium]
MAPETVGRAAEEEPLDAPAGEGGEIESGLAGVLYVRRTSYYYFAGQRVAMRQTSSWAARRAWCCVGTFPVSFPEFHTRRGSRRFYPQYPFITLNLAISYTLAPRRTSERRALLPLARAPSSLRACRRRRYFRLA